MRTVRGADRGGTAGGPAHRGDLHPLRRQGAALTGPPETTKCTLCRVDDSYSLTAARAHLGELVSSARHVHRPVTITEHGKPSVAIINVDDLADLEDRAALAAHYAARLAGQDGVCLADLDA